MSCHRLERPSTGSAGCTNAINELSHMDVADATSTLAQHCSMSSIRDARRVCSNDSEAASTLPMLHIVPAQHVLSVLLLLGRLQQQ